MAERFGPGWRIQIQQEEIFDGRSLRRIEDELGAARIPEASRKKKPCWCCGKSWSLVCIAGAVVTVT
jgi:hypothetical protein